MIDNILIILLLIVISAFFSISEISLAASRKIKLKQLADNGNEKANKVLKLLEQPGHFFTVVQIALNAVAILAGTLGDSSFSPAIQSLLEHFISPADAAKLGFIISFIIVTSLFILFADLIPKQIGMVAPEKIATHIVNAMLIAIKICKPLVWFFNSVSGCVFKLFKLPRTRQDDITSDEISAVVEAGLIAGLLRKEEQELIENVFELESRTVTSSMTIRENVIYFDIHDSEEKIKEKIAANTHSKFLICDKTIDNVIGYISSKDLLNRVLSNHSLIFSNGAPVRQALIIPDTLTLSEALDSFKQSAEDFAVILNEYALVVGIVTLNDVMATLMGDLVGQGIEEQIVPRDEHSWLIDGITPIDDVMRVLNIDTFPDEENYETIGGFMMYMLRKIPKRTDKIYYANYKFEVVDIDNHKVDQLLVTKIEHPPTSH